MPPSVLNSSRATIYLSRLRQVKTLTDLADAVNGIDADGWRPDSDEGMLAGLTATYDDHSADQSAQILLLGDFYAAAANTMMQFSSSSIHGPRNAGLQLMILRFLSYLANASVAVFAGISSAMTMKISQGLPTLQRELVVMLHQKGFMTAVTAACRRVADDWKAGGSSALTAVWLQASAASLLRTWVQAASVPGLIQLLPERDMASSIAAAARLCLVLLQQQQEVPVSSMLNTVLSCSQAIFEVCSGRPQPLIHAGCQQASISLHGMPSKVSDPGSGTPQPQHTSTSHQQQTQQPTCADPEAAVSQSLEQLPDGVWDLLLQALPTMLAIEHVCRNSRSSISKSFAAPTHSSSTGSSHADSSGSGEQQQQKALEGLECLAVPQLSPTLIVTLQQHPECMASLVTDLHLFVQPALLVMYQWARQQQELLSVNLMLECPPLPLPAPNWVKLVRMVIEAAMFCADSPGIIFSCLEVVHEVLQAAEEANVYSTLTSDVTASSRALSNPNAVLELGSMQWVMTETTSISKLQPAQAAGLLQPVLHLLSAAVLHTLRSGKFADQNQVILLPGKQGHRQQQQQQHSEPAAVAVSKEVMQMRFATLLSAVVLPIITAVEPKHLAAAVFQQPLVACAALEMTIRACAREVANSASGIVSASMLPVDSDESCSDALRLIKDATAVAEAVRLAAESPRLLKAAAAAAKAESKPAWQLLQNHLYSLLLSCLKCCSRAASSSFAEATAAVELAETVAAAAAEVAMVDGCCQVAVCSPMASTVLGSCTIHLPQKPAIMLSSALWYVLLARALRMFGRVLVELVAEGKQHKQAAQETASLDPATAAESASAAHKPDAESTVARAPANPNDSAAAGDHRLLEECTRALPYVLGRFRNSNSSVWAPAPGAQAGDSVKTLLEALRTKLGQPPIATPAGCKHSRYYIPSAALRNKAMQQAQDLEQLSQHAASMLPDCRVGPFAPMPTAASGTEQAHAEPQDPAMTSHGPGAITNEGSSAGGSRSATASSSSISRSSCSPICAQELCEIIMEVLNGLVGLGSLSLLVLPLPPLCCSNPDCSCMLGLSEINLVAVRGLCSQCKSARYCSTWCQKQHWPQHKKVCRRMNRPPEGMSAAPRRPEEVLEHPGFKGSFNTVFAGSDWQ